MTVRTVQDLSDYLRDDLAWRRKENSVLHSLVRTLDASRQQAILRGAVAVLYAHWEGFVKTACRAYLEFVRLRRLAHSDLCLPIFSIAIRQKLLAAQVGGNLDSHLEFADWIRSEMDRRSHLPDPNKTITTSNLNTEVFRSLIRGLGIRYAPDFQIAEKPVIEPLVTLRNNLAHGEWRVVDEAEYEQMFVWIDRLMQSVCTEIENAAATGQYRSGAATKS